MITFKHKQYQSSFFLNSAIGSFLESIFIGKFFILLNVKSANLVPSVLFFLKNNFYCQAKVLTDCFATDYPKDSLRFELTYVLISPKFNLRFLVRTRCSSTTTVPSVSPLFKSAGWLEREVWDLFGIFFTNHVDLRRILTDYGFKGHPLRKDFSLNGYYEVRYDEIFKTIISEPVELTQEFRQFDLRSPWETIN